MTKAQLIDELKNSDAEYVTYGDGDLGIPVLRTDAIRDIESMDDESIGDGTWYECDSEGNLVD